MGEAIARIDLAVLTWVIESLRATWLDPVMVGLSAGGLHGAIFLVLGATVAARRGDRSIMALWRLVLAVTLASVVASSVLKPLLGRERPWVAHQTIEVVGPWASRDASMPSGHAATAVAGAIALSLLWREGRAIAWALAALIALSRLYLGVHYPTDLIVGGLVGWASAAVATVGVTPARARPSGDATAPA